MNIRMLHTRKMVLIGLRKNVIAFVSEVGKYLDFF